MIAIQIILAVGFLLILKKFLVSHSSAQVRASKKVLGILFTVFALVAIFSPNSINSIAHHVGVGRGADLLLYLLTLAYIFTSINLYIKSKQDQKRLVELSRRLAILETNLNQNSKSGK